MKTVTLYRPIMFEGAFQNLYHQLDSFFEGFPFAPVSSIADYGPAVDFRETDDGYTLEAELPGFDDKDISIQLNGTTLTIESKKEGESEKKKDTYLIRERRARSFNRLFNLPENADSENITAHFKNGVLELNIKKVSEAKKRTILINT